MSDRRAELARGLSAVHERIDAACAAAGRTAAEVTLVVVTKRFPASDVDLLAELGVVDVGENLDQEASEKLADMVAPDRVRLHFIGRLQSNKARHVGTYASVVHSVDRPKLLRLLSHGAAEAGRLVDTLIQVSLDGDLERGGALIGSVPSLADAVASTEGLRLRGVMAVAPLEADPRDAFARLRSVGEGIRADHPEATWISAGMSGDLEAAVAEGATHLRVGAAILGPRPSRR